MNNRIRQVVLVAVFISALPAAAFSALNGFGPADADHAFPKWYQDANGLALGPCLESNRFCHLPLAGEELGFNPFLPVDFPVNFPSAFSYFLAEAFVADPLSPLKVFSIDLVGSFFTEVPIAGDQVVIIEKGIRLAAVPTAGDYAITHPYGVEIFRNVAAGATIRVDPAEIALIATRLDFETPRQQFVGPFLSSTTPTNRDVRDPVTGNIYLSNPLTPVTVTGSPNGTNFVRVDRVVLTPDNAAVQSVIEQIAFTDLFLLHGKKVSTFNATPAALAFPEQNVAPVASDNVVTVTNESTLESSRIGQIAAAGPNAADFTVPAGLDGCSNQTVDPSGSCLFTVRFSGAAGTTARTATMSIPAAASEFTTVNIPVSGAIDSGPPVVTATFPGNAGSAPANMRIIAQFDDLMNPATIVNATAFTVTGAGGSPVAGAVSYDNVSSIAVFTPSAPLDNGVVYTAVIDGGTGGVADSVGNVMAADFTWSFTGAAADLAQPSIVSTNPSNGGAGFPTAAPLVIAFSEPMLSFTANATNVRLTGSAGPVSGTVSFNAQTNTATFTPSAPLAFGTPHTLAVDNVQDLAGNTVPAGFTAAFVTNFRPAAPQLMSPASGTASVSRPVTLTWAIPADQDGDTVSFRVSVCSNASFVGSGADCQQIVVPPATAAAAREKTVQLASIGTGHDGPRPYVAIAAAADAGKDGHAGLGMMGMAFGLGGVFLAGGRGRRRIATAALLATVVLTGMLLHSCGGSGGGGQAAPQGTASVQVSGLSPGITFFWKVEADDGKGGTTVSQVSSFSTQ